VWWDFSLSFIGSFVEVSEINFCAG